MGGKKLIVAQADAPEGDTDALLFEQSTGLVNGAGTTSISPTPTT